MSTQHEVRYLVATEVRATGGSADQPLRIEGYAAVYNRAAQLPGFQERIQTGAFKRAVDSKQDVVCLFNHDSNLVLGRTTSGTLRLSQDDRGLHYECDLPNTQAGRDTHESVKRGDINGCSFAFTVPDGGQRWSEQEDKDGNYFVMRDLVDLNLHDVSPVTYPTYDGTNVYARNTEGIAAPAELRSSVDNKNAAKRGMMDMKAIDVPAKKENPADPTNMDAPQSAETRPYATAADVPDTVPAAHKKQFMEVFNSALSAAKKDGKSDKDAEKSAFAQAWGVINKARAAEMKVSFRDVDGGDSLEEAIREVVDALFKAFPGEQITGQPASSLTYAKYWEVETYADYVIVEDVKDGGYYKIPYTHDESKPEGEEIAFGAPVAVEKTYVPVERDTKRVAELRAKREQEVAHTAKFAKALKNLLKDEQEAIDAYTEAISLAADDDEKQMLTAILADEKKHYQSLSEEISEDDRANKNSPESRQTDDTDETDDNGDEDILDEEFDRAMGGDFALHYDEKGMSAGHVDGDCEDRECTCQNRMYGWSTSSRSADGKWEFRGEGTRTKRVGGKDLTAKSFAYVGDPERTETWKYPIHDANHVKNALARWGQHKGIPADKEAGVLRKIHAAAKKFGIDVAETKSSEPWHRKYIAVASGAITASEVLRYTTDQPRNNGSFGTTDAERASSMSEHNYAVRAHIGKASGAMDAENHSAAMSHMRAAHSHAAAARAHKEQSEDRLAYSVKAQTVSKEANRSY